MKRMICAFMFTMFFIGTLTFAFNIKPTEAEWTGTVYIRADGSIDPPNAPIISYDNTTYTLIDNITSSANGIIVEKDGILVDGAGFYIRGSGGGIGMFLSGIKNVTIINAHISNFCCGIRLDSSTSTVISENEISDSFYGIRLFDSSNNTITNNNLTTTKNCGIFLMSSSNNGVSNNSISENYGCGIYLDSAPNNLFRNNTLIGNKFGFGIWAFDLATYTQDIDTSNTIDGKPMYYWINLQNMEAPLDAGYLGLINCSEIIIRNLTLMNNNEGVLLAYTKNSTIAQCRIINNYLGIKLHGSSNIVLTENDISANDFIGTHVSQSPNTIIQFNNVTSNSDDGIWLYESLNSTVTQNKIKNNGAGIYVHYSSNTNITLNDVEDNNEYSLKTFGSSNCTIYRNNFTDTTGHGAYLERSPSANISDNKINRNKGYGLYLAFSPNCKLTNNEININHRNFGVYGDSEADYIQDIDTTNTVSGKYIYYHRNCNDLIINSSSHPNAGFLALIESANIIVENMNLNENAAGVLAVNLNNSIIKNNNLSFNDYGIELIWSSNNTITGNMLKNCTYSGIRSHSSCNNLIISNDVADNNYGMTLLSSHKNTIKSNNIFRNMHGGILIQSSCDNTIVSNNVTANSYVGLSFTQSSNNNTVDQNLLVDDDEAFFILGSSYNKLTLNNIMNNAEGVYLGMSSKNLIIQNNFTKNNVGIFAHYSSGNLIHHNNFINNTKQVLINSASDNWDDGYPSGGNYWSDYNGTDADFDGIGDTPYIIDVNNADRYPLIAPIIVFEAGVWSDVSYNVGIISNSTVSDFHFDPEEGAFLQFNVTGKDGTTGFCRVAIPKNLLWVEVDDGWTITVGDQPITDYLKLEDGNFTYLYFTYNHSTKTVTIQGTHVIPEFPSATITPLIVISTVAVALLNRKIGRKLKI